jgi:hypothetical protein
VTVDKQRWSAFDFDIPSKSKIPLDLCDGPLFQQASLEFRLIKTGLPRKLGQQHLLQVVGRQLPLVLEDKVVQAPEVVVSLLLCDAVHPDGGPLVHNGSEEGQRSFDATCRKLHRFLTQSQG